MQIKTMTKYHYPPIRRAKIKVVTIPNASEAAGKLDPLYIVGKNVK